MNIARFATATLLCLPALAMAQSLPHEPAQTGPASEASPMFRRYHDMPKLMESMAGEMARMQHEMEAGPLAPDAAREMAGRMETMARMMRRMSGLADRPSMTDADAKREYDQMQREMETMENAHARGAAKK